MIHRPRPSLAAAACATLAAIVACSGCAGGAAVAPEPATMAAPAAWQAPLPDASAADAPASASDFRRWWQQFDDPLLLALIESAQAASPTIASARSRIEQARAARVATGAALLPLVDASAGARRSRQDLGFGPATVYDAGLQTSWELDLFGGNAAGRDAAEARLAGARDNWHAARIAVTAEVANSYLARRACEAQLVQTRADAASRAETSRLTGLTARSGFQSPANAALARASAAQGSVLVTQQRAACDLLVKSLVELTAFDEAALRAQLAPGDARLPQPATLAIAGVPAEALAQRPDLHAAGLEVVAASADAAQADARRYPRIVLGGSIGAARIEAGGARLDGSVWSVGPVTVSLPIFDAGQRAANVDAARARVDDAAAGYRASLRTAVREVEAALVSLQSTAERSRDADIANQGFAETLAATDTMYRAGMASLFELEDARRAALQAQSAVIDLRRERVAAWITLYRALGGGWSMDEPGASPAMSGVAGAGAGAGAGGGGGGGGGRVGSLADGDVGRAAASRPAPADSGAAAAEQIAVR